MLLQQLSLLAGFDLAAMGPGSADLIHTVAECAMVAFADREAWYGDPRFTARRLPTKNHGRYVKAILLA